MQYTEGFLLDKRYRLESFVGSGSFGEVWVAKDLETDLEVAVKIYIAMDEKGLEEFKKEFQLSFELNHTNLLHANYLGVNAEDRRPYLVMPYCPDGSVSRFAGEMSENEIWRFIHDVAAGLAYLHSQHPPIIHQDIKPDNILILKNGDYVITDFGISKQLRQSLRKSAMSLNSAGAISYMGPERFSKNSQAIKASDIWSLGVAIYELATGDVPFCGMGGSLQKQGADMPELPDIFSRRLDFICASCMAKEPWERPTAAQLRDYTAAVIDGRNPEVAWHQNPEMEKRLEAAYAADGCVNTLAPKNNAKRQRNQQTGEIDNIDAPAKSGFVESKIEQEKSAPGWVPIVLALAGVSIGAILGILLL